LAFIDSSIDVSNKSDASSRFKTLGLNITTGVQYNNSNMDNYKTRNLGNDYAKSILSPSKSPAIRFGEIRRDLKNNQLSTMQNAKYKVDQGLFGNS
jgi:hypothetical protein